MDRFDIDQPAGSIDEMDIFEIVTGGAVAPSPTDLMFGFCKSQPLRRLQQNAVVFALINATATRNNEK